MEDNFLNLSQTVPQDQIYNFFGGIDLEKIFSQKTYPVWAFANEDLKELGSLTDFKNKEIFSILGSADQPIYFLSRGAKLVISCDQRALACLFAEFKTSAFKNLSFREFREIFFEFKKQNSKIYFEKIRSDLSSFAKKFFDYLFEGLPKNIFSTLKKSKFFYGESWYFLRKNNLFAHLSKIDFFSQLKKNIHNIFIFNSNFGKVLKNLKRKFDLVYTSNIFDSKKYCPDNEEVLTLIDSNLKEKGEILITTQESPKKFVSFLENFGYNLKIKEPKKSFWQIFLPTYPYYYILARKR